MLLGPGYPALWFSVEFISTNLSELTFPSILRLTYTRDFLLYLALHLHHAFPTETIPEEILWNHYAHKKKVMRRGKKTVELGPD